MNARSAPLGDLFGPTDGRAFGDVSHVLIHGFAIDSRRVRQGDLFVALPGSHTHGSRYALQALGAGAAALVLPAGAEPPAGAAGVLHPDPFAALALAARRFYGTPALGLTLIGVTGTNGKTTTALLTAHLLLAAGRESASWTTTLVHLPHVAFRPQWTTPPAHDLQRFLRAARDQGLRHAVLEVSSHAVCQRRIDGVRFAVGVATNFSPDHLDFHGSVESYYAAKRAFIRGLPAEAAAVLNADDPRILAMGSNCRAEVVTFGQGPEADVRLQDVSWEDGRVQGRIELRSRVPTRSHPFTLPMPGRHNAYNAAAACAAVLALGVEPELAIAALSDFKPPPRRLERQAIGPFVLYNDVAMNEASYEAVLATVADLAPRQLVVVHALRGNRGPEMNARIARILAAWDRRLGFAPLIVSASRSELQTFAVDHAVRSDEVAAFAAAAGAEGLAFSLHEELGSAVLAAVDRLQPGGVLLLLGTFGMDRGPAYAGALLQRRLGLRDGATAEYLPPTESDY